MPSAYGPSTTSPNIEPTITDSKMGSSLENGYMDGFDPALLDSSAPDASRELEELFLHSAKTAPTSCLSPAELTRNAKLNKSAPDAAANPAPYPSDTQSDSPADSSHASSADSPVRHLRNTSLNSNHSGIFSPGSADAKGFGTNGWANGGGFTANQDGYFGQNGESSFWKTDISMDGDIELSNKAMDSAFDFDSAASSPSPLKMDTAAESNGKSPTSQQSLPASTAQPRAGSNSSPSQVRLASFFAPSHS